MRKIRSDMLAAIKAGKSKSMGNTTVSVDQSDPQHPVLVLLHGNLIARQSPAGAWEVTLAGWPTPTTRARINALLGEFKPGTGVFQQCGKQWITREPRHMCEIGDREWVQV